MNSDSSETLEARLADYGVVLADHIEQERTRASHNLIPNANEEEPNIKLRMRSAKRSPRHLLVGLSLAGALAAAAVIGLVLLDRSPRRPTSIDASAEQITTPSGASEEIESTMPPEEPTLEPSESSSVTDLDQQPLLTVDMFSGRPNPVVDLSEEVLLELEGIVRDLPETRTTDYEPGVLGFRGFLIEPFELDGIRYSLSVAEQLITLTPLDGDAPSTQLVDDQRVAHRTLRTVAAGALGDVIDAVPE